MVNSSALLLGHNYLGGAFLLVVLFSFLINFILCFLLVVLFSFLINFILSVDTKAAQQARAIVKPQLFFSGTG